jgi:hypothetical protein
MRPRFRGSRWPIVGGERQLRLRRRHTRGALDYYEQAELPAAGCDPFSVLVPAGDRIVTPETARHLQAEAMRQYGMAEWFVTWIGSDQNGWMSARLVVDVPTGYVLPAETLVILRSLLPQGLVRTAREPADPADVLEVWYAVEEQSSADWGTRQTIHRAA